MAFVAKRALNVRVGSVGIRNSIGTGRNTVVREPLKIEVPAAGIGSRGRMCSVAGDASHLAGSSRGAG